MAVKDIRTATRSLYSHRGQDVFGADLGLFEKLQKIFCRSAKKLVKGADRQKKQLADTAGVEPTHACIGSVLVQLPHQKHHVLLFVQSSSFFFFIYMKTVP